jgi:hypothetical protein
MKLQRSKVKKSIMKKLTIALLTLFTVFVSCKKDSDNPSGNSSRTIRYEVTGNFTGTILASYTTAPGSTANDPIASTPWSKEITYASNVTAAIIAVSGNGGTSGQKITVVVKRSNSQISSTVVTAGSSGGFSQAAPVVVF